MIEIYWIQRLCALNIPCTVLFVCCAIVLSILAFILMIESGTLDDDVRDTLKKVIRNKLLHSALALSIVGMVFIPTERQLYAIYGIGGALDYIRSNDKANHLPDKVVDAIDKYIETLNEEEK